MKKGFTLLELLIVIGILVILISAAIAVINPLRQFAMANNARRWRDVSTILSAVSQNIIDNRGTWTCPDYPEITTSTDGAFIASTTEAILQAPICNCLVPTYLSALPQDPGVGDPLTACPATYNTRYTIYQDPATARITICAPDSQSENGTPPEICLTQ